jgi:hypothetical protein
VPVGDVVGVGRVDGPDVGVGVGRGGVPVGRGAGVVGGGGIAGGGPGGVACSPPGRRGSVGGEGNVAARPEPYDSASESTSDT